MNDIERALLWIIYEQCVYAGKAYSKLLIHGSEAFAALTLYLFSPLIKIEKRLFEKG